MTLLLRPEQLRAAPAAPDPALGIIEARLEQSAFLGATRKLVCRVETGASITSDADAAVLVLLVASLGLYLRRRS